MAAKRDWSAYNEHRLKELSRFVRESKRILGIMGPPPTGKDRVDSTPGIKPYPASAMFLTNLMRVYLKMSYRDLEAFLRDHEQFRRRLGLPGAPGRDTINRYAKTISEDYLREFNDRLTVAIKKGASESQSMLQVSRSRGTRHVGALPRTSIAAESS
jgi:hypothetical protein